MNDEKPFSIRYAVDERRVLAQGETAEEWAVEVSRVGDVWTTMFYVGVQGFRLARGQGGGRLDTAETHCMFIGRMFVQALVRMRDAPSVIGSMTPEQRALVFSSDEGETNGGEP